MQVRGPGVDAKSTRIKEKRVGRANRDTRQSGEEIDAGALQGEIRAWMVAEPTSVANLIMGGLLIARSYSLRLRKLTGHVDKKKDLRGMARAMRQIKAGKIATIDQLIDAHPELLPSRSVLAKSAADTITDCLQRLPRGMITGHTFLSFLREDAGMGREINRDQWLSALHQLVE